MATELKFCKPDSNIPWGFRVTGGADYDVPLTVIKVFENSLAENAGLQINDVIVRVNEVPTTGLTHVEANELLRKAGNNFTLAVRREENYDLVSALLNAKENVIEVSNTLEENSQNETFTTESSVTTVQQEIQEQIHEEIREEQTFSSKETFGINTLNQVIKLEEDQTQAQNEKKWSTFLQKPNKPKPPTKKAVDNTPKGEEYKVVIKKQPRKSRFHKEEKLNLEEFLKNESKIEEMNKTKENIEAESEENIETKSEENCEEKSVNQNEESEDEKSEDNTEETVLNDKNEEIEEHSEEVVEDQAKSSEESSEITKSVEEQLLQVQKQLEALSKLPSTIQQTLDIITSQLSRIVSTKKNQEIEEKDVSEEACTFTEDDRTEQIDEKSDVGNSEDEENLGSDDKETDDEIDDKESAREEETSDQEINIERKEDSENEAEKEEIEEEESEEIKLERIKKEKQEKERILDQLKEPPVRLKPIDRPIILPGGRRWSQPDDACPAIRHPKMSDEKIAGTIETYSEVLVGKTKGINFLKYQPPPKNLDYLQRSEVFKLIHDMDRPVKGICSRVSKILAEEDYYQETKGSS